MPDKTNHEHNLRDRRHNRSLCVKADEKLSNQTVFLNIHILDCLTIITVLNHVYSVAVCQL